MKVDIKIIRDAGDSHQGKYYFLGVMAGNFSGWELGEAFDEDMGRMQYVAVSPDMKAGRFSDSNFGSGRQYYDQIGKKETPRYLVKVVFNNYDMPFHSVESAYDYIESIDKDLPVLAWDFKNQCWMER